jgi:hypothetical protein
MIIIKKLFFIIARLLFQLVYVFSATARFGGLCCFCWRAANLAVVKHNGIYQSPYFRVRFVNLINYAGKFFSVNSYYVVCSLFIIGNKNKAFITVVYQLPFYLIYLICYDVRFCVFFA